MYFSNSESSKFQKHWLKIVSSKSAGENKYFLRSENVILHELFVFRNSPPREALLYPFYRCGN